jgi:hypothetical protein
MSTQRRFSPGDWRVDAESEHFRTAYEIVSESDGETFWIADVGVNPGDADADAQVMAASKALYLALLALVAACWPCERHLNGTQVYRVEDVRDNGAVQQARAALALVERHADG